MKIIALAFSLLAASTASLDNDAFSSTRGVENSNVIVDIDAEMTDEIDIIDYEEEQSHRGLQATTKRAKTWIKQHNMRRQKYHVLWGGKYKPLRWSQSLEADALAFAKEIALDCKNRVPTNNINDYGVNSAVKANQRNFRSPQALLQMWENQLPKGYPKNKVMTQVLWSATKYVGCADAASPLGADKTCSVAVCYYAKAGNCAVGKFGNYSEAVLKAPPCSKTCPPEVTTC